MEKDSARILVVDDDDAIRNSFHTILVPSQETAELDQIAASLFDEEEKKEESKILALTLLGNALVDAQEDEEEFDEADYEDLF